MTIKYGKKKLEELKSLVESIGWRISIDREGNDKNINAGVLFVTAGGKRIQAGYRWRYGRTDDRTDDELLSDAFSDLAEGMAAFVAAPEKNTSDIIFMSELMTRPDGSRVSFEEFLLESAAKEF